MVCNGCGNEKGFPREYVVFNKIPHVKRGFPRSKIPVVCRECGSGDLNIDNEYSGDISINVGKFSMLNAEGKKRVLKERSRQHAVSQLKINDRKKHIEW